MGYARCHVGLGARSASHGPPRTRVPALDTLQCASLGPHEGHQQAPGLYQQLQMLVRAGWHGEMHGSMRAVTQAGVVGFDLLSGCAHCSLPLLHLMVPDLPGGTWAAGGASCASAGSSIPGRADSTPFCTLAPCIKPYSTRHSVPSYHTICHEGETQRDLAVQHGLGFRVWGNCTQG